MKNLYLGRLKRETEFDEFIIA